VYTELLLGAGKSGLSNKKIVRKKIKLIFKLFKITVKATNLI